MPLAIQDVHINRPLTSISIAYQNAEFIGEQIFPRVQVVKESDKYWTFDKDNFRVEETIKADNAEANKVSYKISSGSYQIDYHALEDVVTPRMMANADNPLSPMQDATEYLTDLIMLRMEKDIATEITNTGNYATGMKSTTGVPILNGSSGDVTQMVVSGCAQIANKIGRKGNVVVMDANTFVGLKSNTTILDRIKYTQTGVVTTDVLASLFEVDKVLVGWPIENTAKEGQTDSLSYIWGEGISILYVEQNPGLRRPTYGYIFSQGDRIVESRQADNVQNGANWIRVIDNYDVKIIDTNAGYRLLNTVQ